MKLRAIALWAVDEIDRLRQRVAELERDAKRYQWLRTERGWERYMFVTRRSSSPHGATEVVSEGELDTAIDAALEAACRK